MKSRIYIFCVLLSFPGLKISAQQSLDCIEKKNFSPEKSLFEQSGIDISPVARFQLPKTESVILDLNGVWQLAQGGDENQRLNQNWSDAITSIVPGSIHTALWKNKIIPDPYIGKNDSIAEKQSYKTWWLKKEFSLSDIPENARLEFGGIANKCTIWLNGEKLGSHEGMFGGPDFDLRKRLKKHNTLIVKLFPIPNMPEDKWPLTANKSWKYTVVFNCVYGWHYAKIPSLGIWQNVRLTAKSPSFELGNPYIATRSIEGDMRLSVRLSVSSTLKGEFRFIVYPQNFRGDTTYYEYPVETNKKTADVNFNFKIKNPQLWWPNDMGNQPLYKIEVAFVPYKGNAIVKSTSFGVRTIEMRPFPDGPKPDKYNWTFVINNKPMFVKGTGWCTMDPLMDFSYDKYDRLLTIAKQQHIQMFRAWGGGMPETDDFYNLCDKYGIMVIQEWPTAWNSHNTQPFYMLSETVYRNTIRIRNHPSLVMWGAGNESDRPFGKAIDMMGQFSSELDGSRPFHRGEAWGGSEHNYNCWWDDAHLNHNLNMTASFWGEFGIASLPNIETVKKYLAEEQNIWPPRVGDNFNHHTPIFGTHNEYRKLQQYSGYFMPDSTLSEFIIGSQLSQVEGVRHTLERARSLWPQSTGALYYKLNDNFPGVSWSSVDFYGAIKPIHYFLQKSLSPLAVAILFDKTNLSSLDVKLPVFLFDDNLTLKNKNYEAKIFVYNDKLNLVTTKTFKGNDNDSISAKLGTLELNKDQTNSTMLFFMVEIYSQEKRLFRNFYFSNYETRRGVIMSMPQTDVEMSREGKTLIITNTGKLPAIALNISCPGYEDKLICSENFFWLQPNESKSVEINIDHPVLIKGWNIKETQSISSN